MYGDDRPLYSWRVLLLPFLEQNGLYDQFHLDEPWDSPHNRALIDRMPSSYEAPWTRRVKVPRGHTALHVLTGPGTPFEGRNGLRLPEDFPDGTTHTLLYVEAEPAVPWTMPESIAFDPTRPLRLHGLFRDGFRASTADARYRFIPHDVAPATLRAAVTRNGGEPLPYGW